MLLSLRTWPWVLQVSFCFVSVFSLNGIFITHFMYTCCEIVGAVFFDTDLNSSFFGILFQGNLFIMLGAMASAPEKLNDREIFYKHDDSNFYPAASYVIGQALALIPQMMLDVLIFGCLVYWMVRQYMITEEEWFPVCFQNHLTIFVVLFAGWFHSYCWSIHSLFSTLLFI